MNTYTTTMVVGAEHLDAGEHVNWRAQLAIAEAVHFQLREQLGLGLESLKKDHDLFLVMHEVGPIKYIKPIREGDTIAITVTVQVSKITRLDFECEFKVKGEVVTRMKWQMPLIKFSTSKFSRIPDWIRQRLATHPHS